jgi:hypothetical protein
MAPFVDLTGKRFGRLVVLRKADKRRPDGTILWQCQCDCGESIDWRVVVNFVVVVKLVVGA